ncbi:MAG: hypothetical protein E7375_00060 [Clostridiales bacterium]|nr:hypothetical protein [Clostridiales bacterium]
MKIATIKISNPDKVLFPREKINKIDLINYYIEVSTLMLPYIENRLLSVIRCHDKVGGEMFFKKHPSADKDMVEVYHDGDEEYFYIKDQSQLVYQVQMGTIEFHPWGSLVSKINKPDVMIFDLDPDDKLSLENLREAVLNVKNVLEELSLQSFLKTSGGKGYHIVVPFSETKDWESFYCFAKQIALLVEGKWPNLFTTNIRKAERKGKIFVDFLRNNRGSTCVAPFSVRAREGASISMPIDWKTLGVITPNEVDIKNYKNYLNDGWKSYFKVKQVLK